MAYPYHDTCGESPYSNQAPSSLLDGAVLLCHDYFWRDE